MTSDRRVFPLVVETPPAATSSASSPSPSPGGNGGRLLPPPSKSPLYNVRRHHVAGSNRQPSGLPEDSGDGSALSGFDRMLMLRQMNVTGTSSASTSSVKAAPPLVVVPAGSAPISRVDEPEVSAAQNLKQRRSAEQRRRQETALMRQEDYLDTPEGAERLRRQEERALMLEEELGMWRLLEAEVRERRRQQQIQEQQEEARVREQYLVKMRQQREQQEREAREKELARKQALEAKMKALKEAADAQAREEAVARQRQMEHDALVDRERRVSAMETALMQLEDALAAAERQQWLAEMERQRQIEAERDQWRIFQELEQAKLREATMQRRAAMAQQYEQDKRRKVEIHRLQKQQAAVVAASVHSAQREPSARAVQLKQADSESRLTAKDDGDSADPHDAGSQATPADEDASAMSPVASRPVEAGVAAVRDRSEAAAPTGEADGATPQPSPGPEAQSSVETSMVPQSVDAERMPVETAGAEVSNSDGKSATGATVASLTADPVPPPVTWTEESARASGVLPFAQVQSVTGGSPAMEATLRAGDLIVDFGGVVASTPKCLLTVAECVQSHVNQAITVVVLRPSAPEPPDPPGDGNSSPEREFQERTVSLCPRKWKGKGLLGCQLCPFKWPEPDGTVVDPPVAGVSAKRGGGDTRSVEASTAGAFGGGGGFVIYGVQADSATSGAGLRDGDLLVSCGDLLDMESASVGEICQRIRQALVSAGVTSRLHLEVERWLADEQRYCHLSFDMSGSDTGELASGFNVTTYEQYYYGFPSASTTSSVLSACTDCYYSTTPSAAHTASLNGHVECLEALLLLLLATPKASSEEERSSIASYLEWKDNDGRTPLFYACYASQLESARFLISHLGSFNVDTGADLYGDTPLHAAVTVGSLPIVRLLLESHYMDANAANAALQTGAHVAPNVGMLRLLESFDADLLATDSEGRMPLAYACLRNDPESVEYLCAAFPDFADYADERGNTLLHLCAWLGLEHAARVLVRFLPSIALFLTNLDGCSSMELARANGTAQIVGLLEEVMNGGC